MHRLSVVFYCLLEERAEAWMMSMAAFIRVDEGDKRDGTTHENVRRAC